MVDLSIFRRTADGFADQVLADARDSGRSISGMTKLAQRFVLTLYRRKNEVVGETAGCDFVARLSAGRASTENDVFVAFAASIGDVAASLRAVETATDSDNERIDKVKIEELLVADGHLDLVISLTNLAAEKLQVSLPLHFVLG